ncbi:MAG: hypothetical protein JWQ72_2506 [Polaromonas sp.]|nr:hypothetical protein [Polaromonas sp.]
MTGSAPRAWAQRLASSLLFVMGVLPHEWRNPVSCKCVASPHAVVLRPRKGNA